MRDEKVFMDALNLPPAQRAELAERLLSSLDLYLQQENEQLWAKEVERRIDAFDKGEIKAVPAEEVFKRIKAQQKS